ncbi:ankyrin repeat-containing domain protein [Lophiotrema nucula]|uniref:Ankyrin repeat-containing domain protein n=1 Tax=Lophiotrema nucula TaxID=690887 RepID=A0A6A5YGU6_9PLEO|nr:ankyrin repeat-containing domain protein [Lophiotrema nucula]
METHDDEELLRAIRKGDVDYVKQLFTKSPAPTLNYTTQKGQTPLHLASDLGYSEIVDILLDKKAPLDYKDEDGRTALHLALGSRNYEIVPTLLSAIRQRPDDEREIIDLRDNEGDTVLNLAAGQGDVDVVNILLQDGADVTLRNNAGATPARTAADEYARYSVGPLQLQTHILMA